MSDEIKTLLLDTLERLLREQCSPERVEAAEQGGFDAELWQQIAELELHRAALPESEGGVAADLPVITDMLTVAARYALPAPVAEAMLLAPWLVTLAGTELAEGLTTVAPAGSGVRLQREGDSWLVEGEFSRVPAGRFADALLSVVVDGDNEWLIELSADQWQVNEGSNLAGEARDGLIVNALTLTVDQCSAVPAGTADKLWQLGALARSAQLVGALRRAQELSHNYVSERSQFGRPLAKFQAIQQQLALLAADLEAAAVMSGLAAMGFSGANPGDIAAAKIAAGQAAGMGARIAHQVHGAMGFTQEYPLHHATRRLWSWRDEYGSETYWAGKVGDGLIERGAEALWPWLTAG
ncbi:MAG: acyl-CoA dehydrogenase family protein [Gammaproteobacteria bacterium]